jgi:hypothetical protein
MVLGMESDTALSNVLVLHTKMGLMAEVAAEAVDESAEVSLLATGCRLSLRPNLHHCLEVVHPASQSHRLHHHRWILR